MARKKQSFWLNKIALITGGSSGIGLATACGLSHRGVNVWLVARDRGKLESGLRNVNASVITSEQRNGYKIADVSQYDQVEQIIGQISGEIGVPDFVINSAGIVQPGLVQELDVDIFHRMMDVNYFGTVNVIKAVLPSLIERGSGHIVNVSSIAGFLNIIGYTAYGSSKFAVRGFSDALRAELKPMGIKVSVVFPPDTDTPQLDYDRQHRPPETDELANIFHEIPPESVARDILKGISRGDYVITPGIESKFLYWASGPLRGLINPIIDILIRNIQ
jgi:3-dehydrosphinganine reductase